MRRTLREATADVLSEDLPDKILEKLADNLQGLGIRKVADLIAIRLALAALDGRESKWLDAVQQLRQLEGPAVATEPDRPIPEIPDDSDRMREVAQALRETPWPAP
jgi:hypothetical protein